MQVSHIRDHSRKRFVTILCLLAICAALQAGRSLAADDVATQPGSDEPQLDLAFQETVAVSWVLVPVTVRSQGRKIKTLTQKHFRLSIDDRPIDFQSFEHAEDLPVQMVFLQDLSGSMGLSDKLAMSRMALECLMRRSKPADQMALATFANERTQVEVPFTSDLSVLRESADRWQAYGTTALHDAVYWLPSITLGDQPMKGAAVLVTDGVDNASRVTAAEARESARWAQLPVYVLGFGSGAIDALDRAGEKLYRYADILNLLAHLTGGQYYPLDQTHDVSRACAALSRDLRHQYVLGFKTQGQGQSKTHKIEVTVKGGKYDALHRAAYVGRAPQTIFDR